MFPTHFLLFPPYYLYANGILFLWGGTVTFSSTVYPNNY